MGCPHLAQDGASSSKELRPPMCESEVLLYCDGDWAGMYRFTNSPLSLTSSSSFHIVSDRIQGMLHLKVEKQTGKFSLENKSKLVS